MTGCQEIVRHLNGQQSAGTQKPCQAGEQFGMFGNPLQGGIGKQDINRDIRFPLRDIGLLPFDILVALGGCFQHFC
jgi:hypothetical protein